MANLEGFKKVSGPTIIGGGATIIGSSTPHSTTPMKSSTPPVQKTSIEADKNTIIHHGSQTIQSQSTNQELKLPPKPVVSDYYAEVRQEVVSTPPPIEIKAQKQIEQPAKIGRAHV